MNYLIVADDFTGSNDTGVQMKKRGLAVEVKLSPSKVAADHSVVLDTETRNSGPDEAYDKVRELFSGQLALNEYSLVYKKMDSTLRGQVVSEIKAMVDVYQPEKVVFAPAFPEIGRTTREGTHYLYDTPLMETEFAKDPLNPIKTDSIVQMMTEVFKEDVTHHTIDEINNGSISLDKTTCHTFDCESDSCLLNLSKKILAEHSKVLWVGSAGLAQALFKTLVPKLPVLTVLGSISEVSLNQLTYAESKAVQVVKVDVPGLLNDPSASHVVNDIKEKLKASQDVVLTAARTRDDYQKTVDQAQASGMSSNGCSETVQDVLGDTARKILQEVPVSGVFLTGGATAISVMKALGITGVEIVNELTTGMVHSRSTDGPFENLAIVTKAGAFGKEEDLLFGIEKLKELG